MKKRKPKGRRNPIAKALKTKRPRVIPSAKTYRRAPKHKRGRPLTPV